MTSEQMLELVATSFYENYAMSTAEIICGADAVGQLYELCVTEPQMLPRGVRDKALFRAAYVLETIYFHYPERFEPFVDRFFDDFAACSNAGAKRHYGKIMTHLLRCKLPDQPRCEAIAAAAAQWAIDPKMRVAVKIGAIEVLRVLSGRVEWCDQVLGDVVELLRDSDSPAIKVRLKNRWSGVRTL